MNSTLKGVLIFVGGLVIGGAGGGYAAFAITKRYFEKENRDAANELAEYYHKKYNDIPEKEDRNDTSEHKEKSNEKVGRSIKEEKDIYEETSGIYRPSEEERKVVTNYSSISNRNGSPADPRPESKIKKGRKKKPYVIDEATWDANEANYDKRFISYYEADNVLIDDESDTQIDIWNELGEHNFNDIEDYETPIIIANDQFKTMYMVEVVPGAWSEEEL